MMPLENEYVENISNEVGEDGDFTRDYVKQVKDATNSLFGDMCKSCGVSYSQDIRACYLNKPSITKAQLIDWLETTAFLLNSCAVPLLDFAVEDLSEVEQLKSEKIIDQRRIIELQDKIIAEKDNKLDSKSCSEALAPRKIAAVAKSVGEKKDRSKNVIVFGVPEEDSESVDSKVGACWNAWKISLKFQLRKRKPATNRPISFRVESSSAVTLILQKAKRLREIEGYQSIYLCPDRTLEERTFRKKLVEQLKEKRANDPNKRKDWSVEGDEKDMIEEGLEPGNGDESCEGAGVWRVFNPPPARKEKIRWPKSNDATWEEFDLRVSMKLKEVQKTLRFQERMRSHCDVVYEEGVRWFDLTETAERIEPVNRSGDRRSARITTLVRERRILRKSLRGAKSELEQNGFRALIKTLNEQFTKLRRAEARRKKQADKRRALNAFKKNPFATIKKILCPNPVGELKCTKEELDAHLEKTYGDPCRGVPLGNLEGLPKRKGSPTVPFMMSNITRREHDSVIRKARSKSAPGNNGISYIVYKRCSGISENLWSINRVAYENGYYPDNCRIFEGVYIPKADGDFGPSTGRPISLGNVQGKIFLAVVARRLTEFMVNNKYVDMSVQKGGLPGVKGCIEHFGAMWEVIKDARLNRRDLSVVWLGLANAYGAVPHVLILKALRYNNIPDKIIKIIVVYFAGVYGRFSSKLVTSKWQKFEIGIFMGCVISVIIFALCMNLSDEYLKVKVPRAIQYLKDTTPAQC
ncbi:hypothetical protein ACHWQZ_G003546 [Mnemiopsis leidyi]